MVMPLILSLVTFCYAKKYKMKMAVPRQSMMWYAVNRLLSCCWCWINVIATLIEEEKINNNQLGRDDQHLTLLVPCLGNMQRMWALRKIYQGRMDWDIPKIACSFNWGTERQTTINQGPALSIDGIALFFLFCHEE